MTTPTTKKGILKSNRLRKGGFVFIVTGSKYGKSWQVWSCIDTIKWRDKDNTVKRIELTRKEVRDKFEGCEVLEPVVNPEI